VPGQKAAISQLILTHEEAALAAEAKERQQGGRENNHCPDDGARDREKPHGRTAHQMAKT
jgi:hypothetical protein